MFQVREVSDFDFFEKVRKGLLTQLEINEYVLTRTGGDPVKMQMMLNDFIYHMDTYEVLSKKWRGHGDGFKGTMGGLIQTAKTSKGEAPVMTVSRFEDLFFDEESCVECVELLKEVKPRVIDEEGRFCLGARSKAAMVAWLDAMKKQNRIRITVSDKVVARLLNEKFKVNVSDRTIRSSITQDSPVYRKYIKQF